MAIIKQKVRGNSSKVTLGDPKNYDNRQSDHNMNRQTEPARPNKYLK